MDKKLNIACYLLKYFWKTGIKYFNIFVIKLFWSRNNKQYIFVKTLKLWLWYIKIK